MEKPTDVKDFANTTWHFKVGRDYFYKWSKHYNFHQGFLNNVRTRRLELPRE